MGAVFRSALVALSAFVLLGTLGFAQADDPGSRGDEAYGQGDYVEAVKWYRLAAEQGNVHAQYNLGWMYSTGEGIPKNEAEAAKWYRLAAEQGLADAQNTLGLDYLYGEGVPKNNAEAARWFRLAAEQGNSYAQYNLGSLYMLGDGVPKNPAEAVRWFRLAAEQGYASAQYNLGWIYARGDGVPQNYAEAVKWYRLAAEQGHAFAQYNLGLFYARGEGVTKNHVEAARLFRSAAEQGDADAQSYLGDMYRLGEGVSKNDAEALRWYRLAAEQGNNVAQNNLGVMYGKGQGVPQDFILAYKWYNVAAAGGYQTAASNRDIVSRQMTPYQIAEAQRLSSAAIEPRPRQERQPPVSPGQVKATGSAFLVSGIGDLVTNAHVVSDCRRLTLADGTLLTLGAYEPASDLALLRSASLAGRTALPLRSGKGIRLADSVIVAGFPLTGIVSPDLNVTTGNVSALSGPDGNRALFQITAPVQSGNSGGPILDQAGNLVGVVVSKLDAVLVANLTGDLPQNVNFGISLGTLQTFLDANDVDYTSQPATRELANASIAEAAKSATFQIVCY
jgi:TPR repeat protein